MQPDGVARFPTDFGAGNAIQLPYLQPQRLLANLVRLDLEANLDAGDADAAVESLLTLVAVSDSLANEPILVSQLVRLACFEVAVRALEQSLARLNLTDEQLARLQEAFGTQPFLPGFRHAARGEQFLLVQVIRSDAPTGLPQLDRAKWLPVGGADLAKGMELWRGTIDASGEGMKEALDAQRTMEDEIERLSASTVDQVRYLNTATMLPAAQATLDAVLIGEARARVSIAAIACERFRRQYDRYPQKLDELAPEFLPAVPEEPHVAAPLRYVLGDSGALLYSIGVNSRDDGGFDDAYSGDLPFRLRSDLREPAKTEP